MQRGQSQFSSIINCAGACFDFWVPSGVRDAAHAGVGRGLPQLALESKGSRSKAVGLLDTGHPLKLRLDPEERLNFILRTEAAGLGTQFL